MSVGHTMGKIYVSSLSSIGGAAGISIVDNTLRGGDDVHNGKWIRITSGDRDGDTSRADDYTQSTTTVLVEPDFSTQIASGVTYEMWDEAFPPARIEDFINQAIIEVTGLAYDPEESLALHGDGQITRFDIPSEFQMLNGIYVRQSVTSAVIHQANTDWDEATVANVTRTVDTKDYKTAGGSVKMVVAAGAAAGLVLASKAISSLDVSGKDYVEFWIKSSVATVAADLQVLLDNTALVVSPLETLDVPALVANTWTFVRVALSTPRLDTAIISVGLKYTVDIGAATIWINDVKAVANSTTQWAKLDKNLWYIDQEAQDLVFKYAPSYRLLKLVGGDKPALLTTDAGVCEVDDQFVTARTIELALLAASGGAATDPDELRELAGYWGRKAKEAKEALPWLTDVRVVG